MSDFWIVLAISCVAALLTYAGAPLAERFTVPHRVVSAALQFAAGIITALVAFSLLPAAVRNGPDVGVVLGFFIGGAIYVTIEYLAARRMAANSLTDAAEGRPASMGLYIGILVDL